MPIAIEDQQAASSHYTPVRKKKPRHAIAHPEIVGALGACHAIYARQVLNLARVLPRSLQQGDQEDKERDEG